jgi:hypothetical protein
MRPDETDVWEPVERSRLKKIGEPIKYPRVNDASGLRRLGERAVIAEKLPTRIPEEPN